MGSAITAIKFPYFLTDKERYNSLDYFRMGIIEEIRFALFEVEDTARNKNLCAECKDAFGGFIFLLVAVSAIIVLTLRM